MRWVAARRFGDAKCLLTAGPQRANGAVYLAGLAIECHLKAEVLRERPHLGNRHGREELDALEQSLWDLVWRLHDLAGLIEQLPDTLEVLRASLIGGEGLVRSLKQIAARWSIDIRYSSRDVEFDEAREFVGRVEEVHRCLKSRH